MKKLFFIFLLATQFMFANNLNITNVQKVDDNHLSFDVSWDNSWLVSAYRDASWIFIKYKNSSGQWQHLDISSATVTGFTLYTYPDQKGIMLSRATSGQGTVTGSVTVQFNGGVLGPLPDFKVFGIEMVYINPGAFYLGDGVSQFRFHQGNDNTLPYHVQNSNVITVGNTANDLNATYLNTNIPATYPTGYDDFYLMKYETSVEQYTEFLNTLTALQQQNRTRSDLTNITTANRFVMANNSDATNSRNPIACNATAVNTAPIDFYCDLNNNNIPNELNDGQNIVATFITISDCLAYLEWASLRPMTDMEFEKATRGTAYPIAYDIANGTDFFVTTGTITNPGTKSESVANIGVNGLIHKPGQALRVGALATPTSTRLQSGGSFYGVMDLSGNTGEFSIYTDNTSLSFGYIYGSGELDINGVSTTWNGLSQSYIYKGGSFYVTVSNTQTFSNSNRSNNIPSTDLDAMNNYNKRAQGIRGCR